MKFNKLIIYLISVLSLLMLSSSCSEKAEPEKTLPSLMPDDADKVTVKVMSSNLRHKSTDTGDEKWTARKYAYISMFSANQPDIAGIQELSTAEQYSDLAVFSEYGRYKIMPGDYTGEPTDVTSRNDVYDGGLMIMWKNRCFDLLDKGCFWLGEKPYEPHYWPFGATDQHCRACIWVKLQHNAGGPVCYLFNTHYPYNPADKPSDYDEDGNLIINIEPRFQCSKEIISIMKEVVTEDDAAIFVVGDMNCSIEDASQGYYSLSPLTEYMWSARHNAASYDGKISFNGFSDRVRTEAYNIDHIFYRGVVAGDFVTVTGDYGVKWVSDHYPITCTFEF